MVKKVSIRVGALLLMSAMWLGQDRFDMVVNLSAVPAKQTTGNGTTLTPTNSGSVLVSGRIHFAPKSSLEINYGRTKDSQKYLAAPFDYRIFTNISEWSGAYVFSPFQRGRIEPFLLAGGGVLKFNPQSSYINGILVSLATSHQTEIAFLYGGGVDYRVFSRVAVRLQYRGLVYKAPDFGVQNLFTGNKGHLAEPSVGLVIKF
jgi:opacity protein-like surface antigen